MPRVSKAAGGAMPGFEADPHGAVQEMEDLEYIERLKRGFSNEGDCLSDSGWLEMDNKPDQDN
jgi:hypothetical protein